MTCSSQGLPEIYDAYVEHATLADEFDLRESDGDISFLGIIHDSDWPFLVIAQHYSPSGYGFTPGVLIVPETDILFMGAGVRLLAYDLKVPKRIWEDVAEFGFWRWRKHGEYVVMSAELELAAWTVSGQKLWSKEVEPPWDYKVESGLVHLDVMGTKTSFPIASNPSARG